MRFALLLLIACQTLPLRGATGADLPSPAPVVRGAFPPGAQQGTTAEVELSGDNLQDASIEFAGRGVHASVISSVRNKLKVKVTVAPDAEAGRRDYRLSTLRGVFVGVFDIGSLPEIVEKESNDDWRKAEPLSLPVLVNGALGSEDWDHFRVTAAANETLVFDVSAARYGSRLDADLGLLNSQGEELAWNDDATIFGDPHLEYTFAKAGDYIVRVGSLAGGANYRLSVGRLPYVRRTLPPGLGVNQATTLSLTGTHMDLVDEVWIGDRLSQGKIVRKSPGLLQARFTVPGDAEPGAYRLHAAAKGREIAIPTEIRVSKLSELTVTQAPLERANALPVPASIVLNGAIESPKDTHYFRFEAKAGESHVFRAESMKLGYHLDPTLTLFDSSGVKLAYADDPGGDDRSDEFQLDVDLSYTFAKTGSYTLAIRDGMYRGGEQLVYRLTLERMDPGFIAELRDPVKTVYAGHSDEIQVRIRRRAGWNTPVDVWAEGLPDGVTVERRAAAPKDSVVKDTCGNDRVIDGTIVLLPVRTRADASHAPFDFKIKARGAMNGTAVEHEAIVRYQHAASGLIYGPMQVQRAQMTVTPVSNAPEPAVNK